MRLLRRKLTRDLRRQRAQSIAIGLTIFLGTMLAVLSAGAYRDLDASYAKMFEVTGFADLWITGGDVEAIAAEAQDTAGVATAQARRVVDVPFEVADRRFMGRVVEVVAGSPVGQVLVTAGQPLDPADPDGVLVEQHLAAHDHLHPGDHVAVLVDGAWHPVTVRGIAASAEYIWPARSRQDVLPPPGSFGVIFSGPALAASLSPAPTEVAVRFVPDPSHAVATRVRAVADAHGAAGIMTRDEQPSNATLREDIDGFKEMALMFPGLFLLAAALATAVLLSRRVRTERTVIGTLRACGFSRRQIIWHYLGHGIGLGLVGAIPGAIVGQFAAGAATSAYTAAIDVPVTVTRFHPDFLGLAVLFGLLTGVVAALGPARAAARIAPAQAMRGVIPETDGAKRPLLERIFPPLGRLPARWRLITRNLGRNRRRTISTMLGVILAATLILVSWGMIDSTKAMLHRQFDVIEQRDATLYIDGMVGVDALATAAAGLDGVAAVEPMLEQPVTLRGPHGDYATALTALPADTVMHRYLDHDRALHLGDGVLLGRAAAAKLGVHSGDEITLDLPASGGHFTARVDGFVDEPLGTLAYASLAAVRAGTGEAPAVNGVAVRFAPGADRARTLAALRTLPGVAVVQDTHAMIDAANDFMGLLYAFVGVMLLLGSALAFTILFVTMTVNIAERTTELATMRASGVSLRRIAQLVTSENLLVTVLGVVPGLIVGVLAAQAFLASFSSDLFKMSLQLSWVTLVVTAGALVATALLSQLPGLRAVRKLDIAKVVRERSA
ncbi:MAG: FtsX-like permease family protein [Kofleriaceae bacterium]|nr:FtsX-like permease family protein [Kofleriaceae bacterium]MCB9574357.1 FtsX-like permease family protein [Kofleriaceae bacterium]